MLPAIERYESNSGARIYRIACQVFPDLVGYVHLVLDAGPPTLIDTGSGYGESNQQVLAGLEHVRTEFGEPVGLADIRRVVVTHGHIDHFGGLSALAEHMQAEVAIHELDLRVLTAYEERVIVASKSLELFLRQAGVHTRLEPVFMNMYSFSKRHVRSVPVDIALHDGQQLDGMRFIHVPGHCPGQVCIALGNILLTADHVLPTISPHQAPESITPNTGLGHYLASLDKLRHEGPFELGLGGHEGPIRDIRKRIGEIEAGHERKLAKIVELLDAAEQPLTVYELTKTMYTRVKGFHVLLALEEVGAHIEYLYERGRLAIANLEEIDRDERAAFRYRVARENTRGASAAAK